MWFNFYIKKLHSNYYGLFISLSTRGRCASRASPRNTTLPPTPLRIQPTLWTTSYHRLISLSTTHAHGNYLNLIMIMKGVCWNNSFQLTLSQFTKQCYNMDIKTCRAEWGICYLNYIMIMVFFPTGFPIFTLLNIIVFVIIFYWYYNTLLFFILGFFNT